MKKYLIKILIFLIGVAFSEETNEIQFQYGILLKSASKSDSIIALEDSSIIHTGDEVRVNIGYPSGSYFYVIFVGTDGEYQDFYSEKSPAGDSLFYATGLPWNKFDDTPGWETFYLMTSVNPLTELESSLNKYEKSKGKIKLRLGNKIQSILDNLTPSNRSIDHFASALEEPLVGGVTFRGDDDELLKDPSITHTCSGKNGIALLTIKLNHKDIGIDDH